MKFLLDTCVLSELVRPRPSVGVVGWLKDAEDRDLAVSVLTLGELQKGVGRLAVGARRRALEAWLGEIVDAYGDRVVDVTTAVAVEWGRLAARAETQGKALPVIDSLIGATALVHDLTVVTRNVADIARTGAKTLDPWV